jgi:hypothetical protein
MCVWSSGMLLNFCGAEGFSNEHTQAFKNVYGDNAVDKSTMLGFTNCGFWERPCGAQWRASLWPANNSSHSGVGATFWWTDSKEPTDNNQKACNWALSIQGKCEEHYWCLHHCHHQWLYSPFKDLGRLAFWGFVILLTHTVGLLLMSYQVVAKASIYTEQHNI